MSTRKKFEFSNGKKAVNNGNVIAFRINQSNDIFVIGTDSNNKYYVFNDTMKKHERTNLTPHLAQRIINNYNGKLIK